MLKKIAIGLAALFIILALVIGAIGLSLPKDHTVTKTVYVNAPIDDVWQIISNYQDIPNWSDNIASVERLKDLPDGKENWKFSDKSGGYMIVENVIVEPKDLLVSRIIKTSYPLEGEWIFELKQEGDSTRISLSESGTIANPFARVIAYYVHGIDTGVTRFLQTLAKKKFNEPFSVVE